MVSKAQYGETDNRIHTISYNDVKAGDWYANAVNYVTLTGPVSYTHLVKRIGIISIKSILSAPPSTYPSNLPWISEKSVKVCEIFS